MSWSHAGDNSTTTVVGPRLPFGSIHVEQLRPVFQHDAVNGINSFLHASDIIGSGGVSAANSLFTVSTGASANSFGQLRTYKRIRYRPGQGVIGRFTALYSAPIANSELLAGIGHAEDSISIGYQGTTFGIMYKKGGVREVQTLTLSVASSHTENVVVTLGGVAHNIAVTNSGNINRTAYEISIGSYTGWKAEQIGSTVLFIADRAGNKTGLFTLAGTSAAGTFAETKAGTSTSDVFVPQSSWNGDKWDGTGNSGYTLDPTKINVFQVKIQYLGGGPIVVEGEIVRRDKKGEFVALHTFLFPNTLTTPSFSNPSFPFFCSAESLGSTTNISVSNASHAGFLEGDKITQGIRLSISNTITTVTASAYQALFTVRNGRYFGGRSNEELSNLISISGAAKHTQPLAIYVFKNAILAGNVNFSSYSTSTPIYVDTAATTCTISDNAQLIFTGHLAETGDFVFAFKDDEIFLNPGDSFTVAAKATTGTPAYVSASINMKEDT